MSGVRPRTNGNGHRRPPPLRASGRTTIPSPPRPAPPPAQVPPSPPSRRAPRARDPADKIIRIRRTENNGPPDDLRVGEPSVEMVPRRLWFGVPPAIDASGRIELGLVPTGGTQYQVLTKQASGFDWAGAGVRPNNGTAIGEFALAANTGSANTAIGRAALFRNAAGVNNTALGSEALRENLAGEGNIAIGVAAGAGAGTGVTADNLTSSIRSIYIGINARAAADAQNNEIVIGSHAIGNGSNTVTLGNDDIAATYLRGTLYANGVSLAALYGADGTTGQLQYKNAAGVFAGANIITDGNSLALPAGGGLSFGGNQFPVSLALGNLGIGAGVFAVNTAVSNSTAYGHFALGETTTGEQNTAFGLFALRRSTIGSHNTAVGSWVMDSITGASDENVAIGDQAGGYFQSVAPGNVLTTSNRSIFIGKDSAAGANSSTNEVVIGHAAVGGGSNTITLGNDDITATYIGGAAIVNRSGRALDAFGTRGFGDPVLDAQGWAGDALQIRLTALGGLPIFEARRSNAGPAALNFAGNIFSIRARPWFGDATTGNWGVGAEINFQASEFQTATAQGTRINFSTCAYNSTSVLAKMVLATGLMIGGSGYVTAPGNDRGEGTVNAQNGYFRNSVSLDALYGAGGSSGQLQYRDTSGVFAGAGGITTDGSALVVTGTVSAARFISGGLDIEQTTRTVSWLAGSNPNGGILYWADRAVEIVSIEGIVERENGVPDAELRVVWAADGTAITAGAPIHSGHFDPNDTPGVRRGATLTKTTLAAGDRLGFATIGDWLASVGNITVTVK